jgi:hypothetical protein
MNEQLLQAVRERVRLGNSKEQIYNELGCAGYQDNFIELLYTNATQTMQSSSVADLQLSMSHRQGMHPALIACLPMFVFIGTMVLWGLVNLIYGESGSGWLLFVNTVLVPLVFGFSVLALPVFIIAAIVIAVRRKKR